MLFMEMRPPNQQYAASELQRSNPDIIIDKSYVDIANSFEH